MISIPSSFPPVNQTRFDPTSATQDALLVSGIGALDIGDSAPIGQWLHSLKNRYNLPIQVLRMLL